MKAGDLRNMADEELAEHISTARRELFGLRFQHATGELDNTAALGNAKQEVASSSLIFRILILINRRRSVQREQPEHFGNEL